MEKKEFETLQKLCLKLSDRNCLIHAHRMSDERYRGILSEICLASTSTERKIELTKKLREIEDEIGLGEKAEKKTEKLKNQFAGVIDDKYFNHFSLRTIIDAVNSGKAATLEEAEKIVDDEMKKQHVDSTKFIM